MKKILFLLLPFIWQCNLDSMFEPADLGSLGNSVISSESTAKKYSIHSRFIEDSLRMGDSVEDTYKSPDKSDITDERYVFYGKIDNDRDVAAGGSTANNTYILFEIRDVGGKIKVNSAYTTRLSRSKPLDLYNARTELPTVLSESGGKILSIGLSPKFSKLTHENLATTNTSRFNYISVLQTKFYTNIKSEGSYSLLKADSGIGSPINSSASIASLKTIVSGSVWNSVRYPGSTSPTTGKSYYFNPNFTLNTSTYPTPPAVGAPSPLNYYGWNIWTYSGLDKVEGHFTEHYLYIYRAPKVVYKIVSTIGGEDQFLLRFVFRDPAAPIAAGDVIFSSFVYANLIRLSIVP